MKTNLYPVTIVQARYTGAYEGGEWLAFNNGYWAMPEGFDGDDLECDEFFTAYDAGTTEYLIGKGNTPNDALSDLIARDQAAKQKAHDATLVGYPGYPKS